MPVRQTNRNIVPQIRIKPIGSFSFLLALHILFLVSYVLLMPAFEGADEPDHLRYIEAVFDGKKVHPVDRANPRQYGIEVYQPPLYYHLSALVARLFPVVFPDRVAINPDKNPRFPFLVHDDIGEIFPFDPPRKTLRFFRALSVLFGIAAFVVFGRILCLLMPENPQGASIILLVAALWPNNLQIFSVVSNDGLVCLLSLSLILAVLRSLNAERPSWKQGLIIGTILSLGLLTKMTMLVTLFALFPLLAYDLLLDRRRLKSYLKILPAVLLPVFFLTGPCIFSRITWYGDPTGEELLKILTPAWLRPSPRSFAEVLHPMAEILPGRFLADLCWEQLTLPFISLQFFVLWLFFNVLIGVRIALSVFKKQCGEETLHRVLVLSSFIFMFFALYRISVNWVGMQIRHVWNLWPITLLAPYFAINGLKFLRRVKKERILGMVFVGFLLILIPINFLVLHNYMIAYKPVQSECRADLNYFALIDYWVQNPHIGMAYLDGIDLIDVKAYREFAQNRDWNNALFYARRALKKGVNERESRLMCARALQSLGKPNEALAVLREEGKPQEGAISNNSLSPPR